MWASYNTLTAVTPGGTLPACGNPRGASHTGHKRVVPPKVVQRRYSSPASTWAFTKGLPHIHGGLTVRNF